LEPFNHIVIKRPTGDTGGGSRKSVTGLLKAQPARLGRSGLSFRRTPCGLALVMKETMDDKPLFMTEASVIGILLGMYTRHKKIQGP